MTAQIKQPLEYYYFKKSEMHFLPGGQNKKEVSYTVKHIVGLT